VNDHREPAWNGRTGTAGGAGFGSGLDALATERDVPPGRLAEALGVTLEHLAAVVAGTERIGVSGLARLAHALRARPVEFLQRTNILSLDVYAGGLDPLYFLPDGQLRYDARIYMREINPRHRVPEGDMTRRNPTLQAILSDELLDAVGKLEVELAYLLRAAVQETGGTL
jgi:hypothetical protein